MKTFYFKYKTGVLGRRRRTKRLWVQILLFYCIIRFDNRMENVKQMNVVEESRTTKY